MKALEPIFQAYEEGYSALWVTGRSPFDLDVDSDGTLRPLLEGLRRTCREQGLLLLSYSMAAGLEWEQNDMADSNDRRTIETALRAHTLLDIPRDQNEVVRVIRGVASMARTPTKGLHWADGRDLKFAFLLEFAEHLVPGTLANGTQTDNQLVAIELAHIVAQSLALRNSQNLVIFHGRDGLLDDLVSSVLHRVRLPQPNLNNKQAFIAAAMALYREATFEEGLSPDAIAHLTANTPNRGLEARIRASHRNGRCVSASELAEQKNADVEELSEHTLTPLDTSRVNNLHLFGSNIEAPRRILERYALALERADASMPCNILLVGPPGTAKTDLALLVARKAKVSSYQLHSPKGSLVGETERKARLQQMALSEWWPCVGFVDEVTENLPLQRSEFDGDSGASRAVTAALLTALSDETRRGRTLIIGTSNCPWLLGEAMRSRFTIMPVLYPLAEDYPGIIAAITHRIAPHLEINLADERIVEAAQIFHNKAGSPRHIYSALSNAPSLHGPLSPETILSAARDHCATTDLCSVIYAELWAVKTCSFLSFFPWANNPKGYRFATHLEGIVNPDNGEIDREVLEKRIKEYKPHANV